MWALLWLALLAGYLAGVGVASHVLPPGSLAPYHEHLAWAAAAISALGVAGLVLAHMRRGKAAHATWLAERQMPVPLGPGELRRALYHARVQALMRPLAGLSAGAVPLYRAEPHLRDGDGASPGADAWRPLAARLGLLGLIDRIVVLRCARIIRRVRDQDGDLCLLCPLLAGEPGDPGLVDLLDELVTEHPELGSRLVLEIDRADLDPAAERAAARLRRIGIGLCLRRVGSDRLDPFDLARRGFGAVRVGAPGSGAGPDATTMRGTFEAAGVALLVDRAAGEPVADELLEERLLLDQPFAQHRSSAA